MDFQNIITQPQSISKLILNYFKVFFQNYKLLIGFNLLGIIGFIVLIEQIDQTNFSENYIWNYLNKSLYYTLYFTLPVSFIYTFFYNITNNRPSTIRNIINLLLDHYPRILSTNLILLLIVFTINFTIKSELLMLQYYNALTFFFVEIINSIAYFCSCFVVLHFTPYTTSFKKYFNNAIIKYFILMFILLLISMFLYKISFNIVIITLDLLMELVNETNLEYLYKYGSIAVEYCDTIALFTVLFFCYFTFTAETKNVFQLDEIEQIQGLNDDENED